MDIKAVVNYYRLKPVAWIVGCKPTEVRPPSGFRRFSHFKGENSIPRRFLCAPLTGGLPEGLGGLAFHAY